MKHKIIIFGLGLILGAGIFLLLGNSTKTTTKYIKLKNDYRVGDAGYLKKGTILKIDEAMPEGFTRYILYVNLKYDDVDNYTTEKENEIIPYWLLPATDTIK